MQADGSYVSITFLFKHISKSFPCLVVFIFKAIYYHLFIYLKYHWKSTYEAFISHHKVANLPVVTSCNLVTPSFLLRTLYTRFPHFKSRITNQFLIGTKIVLYWGNALPLFYIISYLVWYSLCAHCNP